ncbi:hypothetical protein RF640_14645 [Kocuria sp. CPCC 205231]|uniref:hypothetical protein n=1 Tax=Kocuria sp. CPCC 205231 TaxID=3073551 RepID=UPI0034D5275E
MSTIILVVALIILSVVAAAKKLTHGIIPAPIGALGLRVGLIDDQCPWQAQSHRRLTINRN